MKANPNAAGDPTLTPAEARSIMAKRAEQDMVRVVSQQQREAELQAQLDEPPYDAALVHFSDEALQAEIQRRIRERGAREFA